jgi:hypothetical protein
VRLTYVYLIGPDEGPFKVGFASNIATRLSSLQIGCWEELKIHHTVSVPAPLAERIEKSVHHIFKGAHIRGEWFDADLADLRQWLDNQAEEWVKARAESDAFSESACFNICADPMRAYRAVTRYRDEATKGTLGNINALLLAKVGMAAHMVFTQVVIDRRNLTSAFASNSRLARQAEASLVQALEGLVQIYTEKAAEHWAADTKALDAAYDRLRAA